MNYSKYIDVDTLNGPGTRCTLYVSGCSHGCKGCHNKSTWKPLSGHLFTQELEDRIIKDLLDIRINRSGLTLSGGDPLHSRNRDDVLRLVKRVKNETTKTIWLWSGYELQNIRNQKCFDILSYVDVFVDGRFDESLKDLSNPYTGSSNQIIHTLN